MSRGFLLKKGDKIGIVATGSPVNPERMASGLSVLSELGFEAVMPLDPAVYYNGCNFEHECWDRFGCWDKADKIGVINRLFQDSEVKAIICARGGYSTQEILPILDYQLIRENSKPIIGFSDCTPLLLNLFSRSGVPAIHGPVIAVEFADYHVNNDAKQSVDALFAYLQGERDSCEFLLQIERVAQKDDQITGTLLGGNLSMLASGVGTPWDISFDSSILFVEDIGELPYRVHRLFTQLAFAGKLDNLAALVFGEFIGSETVRSPSMDATIGLIVRELLCHTSFPVFKGLPVGHGRRNFPMPLGSKAQISGSKLTIFVESE